MVNGLNWLHSLPPDVAPASAARSDRRTKNGPPGTRLRRSSGSSGVFPAPDKGGMRLRFYALRSLVRRALLAAMSGVGLSVLLTKAFGR